MPCNSPVAVATVKRSRRLALLSALGFLLFAFGLGAILVLGIVSIANSQETDAPAPTGEKFDLSSRRQPGDVDRVVLLLEAQGKVIFGQKEDQSAALSLRCLKEFDERLLDLPVDLSKTPLRSARYYHKVEGEVKEGDVEFDVEIRPDRKLTVATYDAAGSTIYSPAGPLTADEVETLDTLGNTLLVDRLLPTAPVAIGEAWSHDDTLLAALVGLDVIAIQDVKSTLTEVDEDFARFDLAGKIEGARHGISNEIEVTAKYRFNRKTGRIDWLAVLVHQKRGISRVGDGLDVSARAQMQITPIAKSDRLTDLALAGYSLEPTDDVQLIEYHSGDGKWSLLHDPRWNVVLQYGQRSVLRLIDKGEYVVQCIAVTMPETDPEKMMTLADFQRDIQAKLGDSFQQFVSASQNPSPEGHRVYQVVAQGTVQELPMHWIYYLVTDREGRQVVLALTMHGDYVERYKDVGRELAARIRFNAPKTAGGPLPSPQ